MPPESRDAGLLWDVVRHARELHDSMRGVTQAEYMGDRNRQLVAERLLSIVGEAANKVSAETRARYPDVPWPAMVAQRHVLVHDYGRIIQEKLWIVISAHIPALLASLRDVVPSPPPPSTAGWETER